MNRIKKTKSGFIVHDEEGHHSHNSKGVCQCIQYLLDHEMKPNDEYIKKLHKKGIDTTIERLEESILRFVSVRKYNKWKQYKEKQKYYNVNKGARRVI